MTEPTRHDFSMYACDSHEIFVQLVDSCDDSGPLYMDDKTCFGFFVRMPGHRKRNFITLSLNLKPPVDSTQGITLLENIPEEGDITARIKLLPEHTADMRVRGEKVVCLYEFVISQNAGFPPMEMVKTVVVGNMTVKKGRGTCGDCGHCSTCTTAASVCR